MVKIELSIIQVADLMRLIAAKQKRVLETGDGPYWRALYEKFDEALSVTTTAITKELLTK